MLYCLNNLENIDRILERTFQRAEYSEEAEVAKYENGIFTYLASTYQVFSGERRYEMDKMLVQPEGLLRTFQIRYTGYAEPGRCVGELDGLSADGLAVHQQGPGAVRFVSAVAASAGKKLGIFFFCEDLVSELAVRHTLAKYDVRGLRDEASTAQTWIAALTLLGRF